MATCNPIKASSPSSQDLKTSDVSIYDGSSFLCVTGINPNSSSLNDVIAALESHICGLSTPDSSTIVYDGSLLLGSCSIALTTPNPTVNTVFEDLANKICDVESILTTSIANLNTTDLTISSATASAGSCFGTFTDSTPLNEFLEAMATEICGIPPATPATVVNLYDYESISRVARTWTGVGGDSTHGAGSLNVDITAAGGESRYYINGEKVSVSDTTAILLSSNSDNYLDVDTEGDYSVTAVSIGSPEPVVDTNSQRIAKYETDGTGVVSYTDRRVLQYQDGERWFDDSVLTRHITDLNVTGDKLEDFGTAGTSDWSLGSITVDTKGRVQSWTNNTTITSLSDKDILQYNAGSGEWENVNLTSAAIVAGASQGETLYWDAGLAQWTPSFYLSNMPNSVGIGVTTIPTADFQLGYQTAQQFELTQPLSSNSTATSGGSLAANTYYYAVSAVSESSGETLVSLESSVAVDGVTQTAVLVTWTESPLADRYRIYKGVATGVYTEFFEVTADNLSYLDDATAGTAGSPVTTNNAYSVSLTSTGIGIGTTITPQSIVKIKDLSALVEVGIDLQVTGTKGAETTGVKSVVDATNTTTNIGGWFKAINAANNYTLRLEDGVDNTGKYLTVLDADGNIGFDVISASIVQELDDLTDVSAASPNDWDTLRYDAGTSMWVTSGSLSNDGDNVAIGDKPGSIDARLHINSTNAGALLKIEDSVVGDVATIDASGVLTYNEQFKYTFTNGGAAPLGTSKFLKSVDNNGNAEWSFVDYSDLTGTPPTDTTFANTNLLFTGDRSHDMAGYDLIIRNGGKFAFNNNIVNANGTFFVRNNATEQSAIYGLADKAQVYARAVRGEAFSTDVTNTENTGGYFLGQTGGANTVTTGVRGIASIDGNPNIQWKAVGGFFYAGNNVNNSGDVVAIEGKAVTPHGDNTYGISIDVANSGAGTSYIGQLDDGRTTGAGKFLKSIDADGTAEWDNISLSTISDPYVYEQITISSTTYSTGTEHTIFADTTSNDVTINLPAAASNDGRVFVIKKIAAANKVVLDGNASETIDGNSTHEMFGIYDWVKVQCNGSNWFIIA